MQSSRACIGALLCIVMIALIDCNNFFVSCELTRRPELRGRPVVVGGRGDSGGCVVAMSNEAKAIGITRGVPVFKIKDIIARHNVAVLPADHHLYSLLSDSVMSTIKSLGMKVEVYSVDEAFLHLDFTGSEAIDYCRYVRSLIIDRTGIPSGIGIAPTKTLAKVAARFAKRYAGYDGVCLMDTPDKIVRGLQLTAASDVWGIGRRLNAKLSVIGIKTALDFYRLDEAAVKRRFTAPVHATWLELHGTPALDEESHQRRHLSCACTRTFDHDTYSRDEVAARVARYAVSVAGSLRRHSRLATEIEVMLQTNRHKQHLPQRTATMRQKLSEPTADSMKLAAEASQAFSKIWADGYTWKRAGVTAIHTIDSNTHPDNLFTDVEAKQRRLRLMQTIDNLNDSGLNVAIASTIKHNNPH